MEKIFEKGKGKDKVSVKQIQALVEKIQSSAVWKIERWASKEDYLARKVYSEKEAIKLFGVPQTTIIKGNLLLNEGINELFTLICSSSGTKFDSTNAYLGVGDSNAAESATQTGLQATTNKLYKGMMTGYPTYGTNQQAVWKAQFLGTEANFAWNEFTVANGNSDAAKNLNRKVSAQGTKTSGQVWELTLTITLS